MIINHYKTMAFLFSLSSRLRTEVLDKNLRDEEHLKRITKRQRFPHDIRLLGRTLRHCKQMLRDRMIRKTWIRRLRLWYTRELFFPPGSKEPH